MFGATKLPRVAFQCLENMHVGCARTTWSVFRGSSPDDMDECQMGRAIGGGGCTAIQALHGKPKEIALNDLVPGSESTREVFTVIKSHCDKYGPGEMPNTLTFRPAVHDGPTYDDRDNKRQRWQKIDHVRQGLDIGCGPNRWTNDNCPDFKFVHLAPQIKDGKGKKLKHDAMIVYLTDLQELLENDANFLENLQARTGVEIEDSSEVLSIYMLNQHRRAYKQICEIGFYNGTNEQIEECKREIRAKCVSIAAEDFHVSFC